MNTKVEAAIQAETAAGSHPLAPFAIHNLSVLAYANGFTLWHYRAGKATTRDVATAGFFNQAGDILTAGDMIMVNTSDGARILTVTSGDPDNVRTGCVS